MHDSDPFSKIFRGLCLRPNKKIGHFSTGDVITEPAQQEDVYPIEQSVSEKTAVISSTVTHKLDQPPEQMKIKSDIKK